MSLALKKQERERLFVEYGLALSLDEVIVDNNMPSPSTFMVDHQSLQHYDLGSNFDSDTFQ